MMDAEALSIILLLNRNTERNGKKLVGSALAALEAEGIHKVALVAFGKNVSGNILGEKMGFTVRDDLIYRNKSIHELKRIDVV